MLFARRDFSVPPFLLFVSFLATACSGGPKAPEIPLSTRPSLGELVYRVVRDDLRRSAECPAQYVAELEVHHSDFVTTFDYVIDMPVLIAERLAISIGYGSDLAVARSA